MSHFYENKARDELYKPRTPGQGMAGVLNTSALGNSTSLPGQGDPASDSRVCLTVFGGFVMMSIPLFSIILCYRAIKKNKLDLLRDRFMYSRNIHGELCRPYPWSPGRNVAVEFVRISLLAMGLLALLHVVPNITFLITWRVYDATILLQLLLNMMYRFKEGLVIIDGAQWSPPGMSRASMWYMVLYLTISLFLNGWITVMTVMAVLCFDIFVIFTLGGRGKFFLIVEFPLSGVVFISAPLCAAFSSPFDCAGRLSILLIYMLCACIIISAEGSVFRNLPELCHILSAAVCCTVYAAVWRIKGDPNIITDSSDPLTLFIVSMVGFNLLVTVIYDCVMYTKSFEHQWSSTILSRLGQMCSIGLSSSDKCREESSSCRRDTDVVLECSICLESIENIVATLDCCKHNFHSRCILKSLTVVGERCPLCRAECNETNIRHTQVQKLLKAQRVAVVDKVDESCSSVMDKPSRSVPSVSGSVDSGNTHSITMSSHTNPAYMWY